MFDSLLGHARKIRHVLDAWCVLILCPVVGFIPWLGLPFGILLGVIGIGTVLQLIADRQRFQSLFFGLIFCGWILVFPPLRIMVGSLSPPLAKPPIPSKPPTQPFVWSESTTKPIPGSLSEWRPAPKIPRRTAPTTEATSPPLVIEQPSPHPKIPEKVVTPSIPTSRNDLTFKSSSRNLTQEAEAVVGAWWEARGVGNVDKAVSLHTDPCVVNRLKVSHQSLAQRLSKDWKNGPISMESVIGTSTVTKDGENWRVESLVRFTIPIEGVAHPIRGQSLHSFILVDTNKSLRILEHSDASVPSIPSAQSAADASNVALLLATASSCLEADVTGDLDASMDCYAPTVRYFNKSQSREQTRADKQQYFERWPRRSERFEGAFTSAQLPNNRASGSFRSRFRTENFERREWCEGTTEHHFVFELSRRLPIIVEQSSTLIESKKGSLPP